ncbi:MAG: hypothetical protein R2878_12140 [Thermoleophilia bacterium]
MIERVFFFPNGRLRTRRMVGTVIVFAVLALFGSLLTAVTPVWATMPHAKVVWVTFAVFFLKVPLIALAGWLIVRNKELPGREVVWSERETAEILAYLKGEAERAVVHRDVDSRLAYLSGEAWHVADRARGGQKADAVSVALEIDQLRRQARRPRTAS